MPISLSRPNNSMKSFFCKLLVEKFLMDTFLFERSIIFLKILLQAKIIACLSSSPACRNAGSPPLAEHSRTQPESPDQHSDQLTPSQVKSHALRYENVVLVLIYDNRLAVFVALLNPWIVTIVQPEASSLSTVQSKTKIKGFQKPTLRSVYFYRPFTYRLRAHVDYHFSPHVSIIFLK